VFYENGGGDTRCQTIRALMSDCSIDDYETNNNMEVILVLFVQVFTSYHYPTCTLPRTP
jgi:hypothetical protein